MHNVYFFVRIGFHLCRFYWKSPTAKTAEIFTRPPHAPETVNGQIGAGLEDVMAGDIKYSVLS